MLKALHVSHDVERGHEGEAARGIGAHMDLVCFGSPSSIGDSLALFHSPLVQLSKVIGLVDAGLLSIAFVVKEGGVVLRNALIVLHVAERMEDLLIRALSVLELLRLEIVQVAVGAT